MALHRTAVCASVLRLEIAPSLALGDWRRSLARSFGEGRRAWFDSSRFGVFATLRFHAPVSTQRRKGAERMYPTSAVADRHGEFRQSRLEIFEIFKVRD